MLRTRRSRIKNPRPAPLAALLGLAIAGCGQTPAASNSSEEATVTGIVTIKGKPTTSGGTVTFNPANVARKDAPPREAKIDPDGRYTIKTLIGHNTASVRVPKAPRDADIRRAAKGIDVTSGDNTLDLDVPAMPVPFVAPSKPTGKLAAEAL